MSLDLELRPERAFLCRRESVAVQRMPGFERGRHRLPVTPGPGGDAFVRRLGAEDLAEEVRAVYDNSKQLLRLRRRQLQRAIADDGGNVDAPQFRFAIEVAVDRDDPRCALWQRQIVLLVGLAELPSAFDHVFPTPCDELVIPFAWTGAPAQADRGETTFDVVVDRLEDFAELHGGAVREDEERGRAVLTTPDGSQIEIDLPSAQLRLRILGHDGCVELLREAERRFASLARPVLAALERGRS